MVLLRYRMGQWERRKVSKGVAEPANGESDKDKSTEQGAAPPVTPGEINDESWLEVNPVEAMVEGVKSGGVGCFYSTSNFTNWLLYTREANC